MSDATFTSLQEGTPDAKPYGEGGMIALRVARGVTNHFAARWPEWVFSVILFAMGVRLFLSESTFSTSRSFDVMAKVASEDHWAMAICTVSGLRLVALTINGTFRRFARISPIVRAVMSLLSGFIWFSIALGFLLANPQGWGFIPYTGLLIADIINASLAGGDAGVVERRIRNGRSR